MLDSYDWSCRQREDPHWNGARQGLLALLRPQSGLPTNKKLLLYKTIVRPIVTYADRQDGTRSLPEQDAPPTDEHTMVRQEHGLPTVCRTTQPA
ncbi:hypothetical protein J6590_089186 [Homalodisca vitripennis]|nr:hypothetical protein J6590_089186 [Homalodisca vitripennis]